MKIKTFPLKERLIKLNVRNMFTVSLSPTAPPSIRMQSLEGARRVMNDLASTPSSERPSPDVPTRPSTGPATKNSNTVISSSAMSPSVNVTSSLPPYTLSSITAPPLEVRHAPKVINLSSYHQSVVSLFMAMVTYCRNRRHCLLYHFYLTDIPKQWYFQLNDTIKSS